MVFRETDQWAMETRWQGRTHRIELNEKLDYHGPLFSARLDPDTFELEQIDATETAHDSDKPSLEPVAAMHVLLKGFSQSLPYLPTVLPIELAATGKIAHPGYAE